jgi:hypothetical protein
MASKSRDFSNRDLWFGLNLTGWFSMVMAFLFFSAYKYSDAAVPAGLAFAGLSRIAWLSSTAIKALSARIDLLEKAKEEDATSTQALDGPED